MKKLKNFQLRDLDPDFWRLVKVLAARSGLTIRQLIIDAIKEYMLTHD